MSIVVHTIKTTVRDKRKLLQLSGGEKKRLACLDSRKNKVNNKSQVVLNVLPVADATSRDANAHKKVYYLFPIHVYHKEEKKNPVPSEKKHKQEVLLPVIVFQNKRRGRLT